MFYCEGTNCSRRDQCAYHEYFVGDLSSCLIDIRQFLDWSVTGTGFIQTDENGKPSFCIEYHCGDNAGHYKRYKAIGWREGQEYRNSLGLKYDEICVSCPHRSTCFRKLESAGLITYSGERIMWNCEDIKKELQE